MLVDGVFKSIGCVLVRFWFVFDFPGRLNLITLLLHIFHRNEVRPFFSSDDLSDALGGSIYNFTMLANEDPTMLVSKLNETVGFLGALTEVNGDVSSAYETTKLILMSVQLRDPFSISGKQSLVLLENCSR